MARSALQDPLTKYSWLIDIDGFTRYGFSSCSTPSHSISTYNYREGGAHLNPRNIIESISYAPVTLMRGVTNDTSFNRWATGPFDLVQNDAAIKESTPRGLTEGSAAAQIANATGFFGGANTPAYRDEESGDYPFQYRRTVTIKHVNRLGQVIVTYELYNAYPIEYKPASDFDSRGDDTLSLESITLAYEGFSVKYSGLAGAAASLATDTFSGII